MLSFPNVLLKRGISNPIRKLFEHFLIMDSRQRTRIFFTVFSKSWAQAVTVFAFKELTASKCQPSNVRRSLGSVLKIENLTIFVFYVLQFYLRSPLFDFSFSSFVNYRTHALKTLLHFYDLRICERRKRFVSLSMSWEVSSLCLFGEQPFRN